MYKRRPTSRKQTAPAHVVALLCRQDLLVRRLAADCRAEVEPGLEVGQAAKDVGQQEVEQTPQLAQVVLQRRACRGFEKARNMRVS
jgi:hypothetical protein